MQTTTTRPPAARPWGHSLRAAAALGATAALVAAPAWAGTTSTNLPNGAALSASVTSPVDGDTFLVPPGSSGVDVPLTGTASVGEGEPDVAWIYIVDVSASTDVLPCAGGSVLDCEKQAVANLNDLVITDGSALEVGLGIFGSSSTTADIDAAAGDQLLTAPADPDVDTVIGSIVVGGVTQFTARAVGSGATNYTAGLQAADTLLAATTASFKNVVFLSDGESNIGGAGFAAALSAVAATGADIHPFAVGGAATCGGGSAGTLDAMAAATGTTCTPVPNPADLPDIVGNVTGTELVDVSVTVDGAPVTATVSPTPPQPGPITVDWTATAEDLAPGHHEVCVTADGRGPASDPAATGSVTRCETISVFGFDLQPPHAVNELGSDDSHTVTATVSGPAGELAGWPVDLAVTAGPNAGESGTCAPAACTTDASGQVAFTYTVPIEPDSLGLDTITGAVDVNGETASIDVTKLWQDTTPPTAACPAGPNPAGTVPTAPGRGGQGQNQDGFFHLEGADDVWPADSLELYVRDTGSGTVFGPFAHGDDVKYTEANGATPSQRPGSGEVEWRLKGRGDAEVFALDGSGNTSEPVDCLVPDPPM